MKLEDASPQQRSRSASCEDEIMPGEKPSLRDGSQSPRDYNHNGRQVSRESESDNRYRRRSSRSKSRSCKRGSGFGAVSPKKDRSQSRERRHQRGIDVMNIADEDASFILGAGGRTKRKLSRVCGAELNIKEHEGRTILEIRGNEEARDRAKLYVDFVMQQRIGPVRLKPEQQSRDDLTCIKVPHECVGYVTGRKGLGLRSIEEEWGTLMFFTDLRSENTGDFENLAIFAPDERKRRGAELKVMSAVEQKMPGHYTRDTTEFIDTSDAFGTDRIPIKEEDYSYALGKEGATRKKLARASGAVLEYVGRIAFISGTKPERERAREYLQWLCAQRTAYVHVVDEGRNDCMVVQVPTNCVAYVTGSKGSSLRRIEDISGTFIFLDGTSRGRDKERLLIFGHDSNGRRHGKELVLERIEEKLSGRSNRNYFRGRSRSRSPYNGRDDRQWWDNQNRRSHGGGYGNDARGGGGHYNRYEGYYGDARPRDVSYQYHGGHDEYHGRRDYNDRGRYADGGGPATSGGACAVSPASQYESRVYHDPRPLRVGDRRRDRSVSPRRERYQRH